MSSTVFAHDSACVSSRVLRLNWFTLVLVAFLGSACSADNDLEPIPTSSPRVFGETDNNDGDQVTSPAVTVDVDTNVSIDDEVDAGNETEIGTEEELEEEIEEEPLPLPNPCDPIDPSAAALVSGVPYATIQAAVDAVPNGGVVEICPGTHTAPTILIGEDRDLVLTAANGDASTTILSGGGTGRVITAEKAQALVITNLTIADGFSGYEGAGVVVYNTGSFIMEDSVLSGHYADYLGGALYLNNVNTVTITGSLITSNTAMYESAGFFYEAKNESTLVIEDTTFEANFADYAAAAMNISVGGQHSLNATLTKVTFNQNEAGYEGGGMQISGDGDIEMNITDCSFTENQAGYAGGALCVGRGGDLQLKMWTTEFINNSSDYEGGAVHVGGGLSFEGRMTEVRFDGNTTNYEGAAIELDAGGGGMLMLVDSWVLNNEATGPSGAIQLSDKDELFVINVDFGTDETANSPSDIANAGNTVTGLGNASNVTCPAIGECSLD